MFGSEWLAGNVNKRVIDYLDTGARFVNNVLSFYLFNPGGLELYTILVGYARNLWFLISDDAIDDGYDDNYPIAGYSNRSLVIDHPQEDRIV